MMGTSARKTKWGAAMLAGAVSFGAGCAPKDENLPDVQALWRAAQERKSQPLPAVTPRPTPVAFINVATIAARHPAWRLANALEGRTSTTLDFAGIAAPQAPQPLPLQSAPLQRQASNLHRAADSDGYAGDGEAGDGEAGDGEAGDGAPVGEVPGYNRPAQRLMARDIAPLENEARTRQQNSLTNFLSDVAERQEAARDDQRALWVSEAEDEIEAAQRLALAALQPILPPPDVQLEMTNLRLILMLARQERSSLIVQQVSAVSDAERDAAATRLRALEAEWREKLRAQENARLEELKKLQFEMPERMRRQSSASILQRMQNLAQQDLSQRTAVNDALRQRIAAGFGADDTDTLSIFLPPANLAPQRIQGGPAGALAEGALALVRNGGIPSRIDYQIDNRIISTNAVIRTSKRAFASGGATRATGSVPAARAVTASPQAQTRAQLLRKQAWQEAERWAQAIARRQGWKLQTRRVQGTPDRTREALNLLNLS